MCVHTAETIVQRCFNDFRIEDMSSLARALQIKEITIDGNPVTLHTDYISFLVSYLPNLQLLSTMQISEQIRRTAMAWRFSKEQSNSAFLDLSTQVCMSVRREEVISNAKTNWEFLRARTKVSLDTSTTGSNINMLLRTQGSAKFSAVNPKSLDKVKIKGFGSLTAINENMEARKMHIKKRSSSSENLFKLEDTSKSYPLEFKLPPILGSIVNSLTSDRLSKANKENDRKMKYLLGEPSVENLVSDSETDSSSQSHESLKSGLKCHLFTPDIYVSSIDYDKAAVSCNDEFTVGAASKGGGSSITTDNFYIRDNESHARAKETLATTRQNSYKYHDAVRDEGKGLNNRPFQSAKLFHSQDVQNDCQSKSTRNSSGYCSLSSKTSSVDSCKSLLSDSSVSSVPKNAQKSHDGDKDKGRIKSAQTKKVVYYKSNRAATARAKFRALAPPSPPSQQVPSKEREQGKLISTIFFFFSFSSNLLNTDLLSTYPTG